MGEAATLFRCGQVEAQQAMNEFLQDLSAYSRALWAVFVLGVTAGLALGLYGFWEVVLRQFTRNKRGRLGLQHSRDAKDGDS